MFSLEKRVVTFEMSLALFISYARLHVLCLHDCVFPHRLIIDMFMDFYFAAFCHSCYVCIV